MSIEDIIREVASKEDIKGFEKAAFGRRGTGYGTKPVVVVVDMTNEFVDPKYPLASGDLCIKASHAIRELLEEARAVGVPIIYTRGFQGDIHPSVHGISRKATGIPPSKKLPGANEIYQEISPAAGDIVLEKAKASPFFGTPLPTILNSMGADTLIITGATTSGCVRAAVVDGSSYGYYVMVPLECCGDRSSISHKVSLMDMHMKYADVLNLSEVKEYVRRIKIVEQPASRISR